VSFDRGRVERQRDGIFAGLGQRFKDCAPSPALGPAVEAIVDRRVRAVFTRAVAPSRTRLQHVNDPAEDAPVVVPIRPRQSRRQMRLDTCPLPVIQPKQTRAHSLAPNQKLAGKGITSRYFLAKSVCRRDNGSGCGPRGCQPERTHHGGRLHDRYRRLNSLDD
jgi:hypothetical protein